MLSTTKYLTGDTIAETLRGVGEQTAGGKRLVLDYWSEAPSADGRATTLLASTRLATAFEREPIRSLFAPSDMEALARETAGVRGSTSFLLFRMRVIWRAAATASPCRASPTSFNWNSNFRLDARWALDSFSIYNCRATCGSGLVPNASTFDRASHAVRGQAPLATNRPGGVP